MPPLPTGTELVRPFLPATDFARSKRFYEALGFETLVDGDVAIYRMGASGFILQPVDEHARARNMMMQLMVDDLDAWWAHIEALDLPARVGTTMMRPPAMQPWGLRVAFIADPGGVLWHVAERRPGVVQD